MLRNNIIHNNASGFRALLNEVLSLNAQESSDEPAVGFRNPSSMKS